MSTSTIPTSIADPINAQILSVSEDKIQGFHEDPFTEIARLSGIELPVVVERIQAMLRAGVIRRVRQTLLATNLAHGSLVAWVVPEEKLSDAFDFMFKQDPFSGHIVIRSTDAQTVGSKYRLWTTLKVPEGFSLDKHCELLMKLTGATEYRLMPAKRLFVLGVGHVRRKGLEVGSKSDELAEAQEPEIVHLSDLDWQVLVELKREFEPQEVGPKCWIPRAKAAGVSMEEFVRVARSLNERKVVGRFSTFLEHTKPNAAGERVTKFNALFHWGVPKGREIEAGQQVGRFHVMTHAYWREGGPDFGHVNIMGVAHGTDRNMVLSHKAAIDKHLVDSGIPLIYTNVFWGGRSEIKPSEISPFAYRDFCKLHGLDPDKMRV